MKISEIFRSIDGEGPRAGYLATFIRTHGCLLRCSYCDSKYAIEGDEYKLMSIDQIMEEVERLKCNKITLTGGEPLIQSKAPTLIAELSKNKYQVQIETCGAVSYTDYLVMDNVFVTADWKCPSSGMQDKMIKDQIKYLRDIDVLKFVVSTREDLDVMQKISQETSAQIFISPIFGKIEPKEIIDYMQEYNLFDCRLQVQLHKICYDPMARGV